MDIAQKVEADEVALLEAKLKSRRNEYQQVVSVYNPITPLQITNFDQHDNGSGNNNENDDDGEDDDEVGVDRSQHDKSNDENNDLHGGRLPPERIAPSAPLFHRGLGVSSPINNRHSPNKSSMVIGGGGGGGETRCKNRGVSAPESGKQTSSSRIPRIRNNEQVQQTKDDLEHRKSNSKDMINLANLENNNNNTEMLSTVLSSHNRQPPSSHHPQYLEVKKKITKKSAPKWKARAPIDISTDYIPVKGIADKGLFDAIPDSVRAITPPKQASTAACKRRQEARDKRNTNILNKPSQQQGQSVQGPVEGGEETSDRILSQSVATKEVKKRQFTSGDALASLMEKLATK